ncbi:ATP-dependent DNA helicase RecG [Leptospira sp. GIMC2001]|uniref:ATP-dependent DNA helicase RecG n=1 Tax=Leptospira sp. GIMC2001 TaxID=1513297 RepID=UPI00234A04AE|nr:ATP-dependent DNA helicase RecG [Leptospira sp. GIMC2001]WCL48878.1 ATP-dependent DNA helicase RecG [Leptospira sp. GIMC2001]
MSLDFNSPLTYIKGIGTKKADVLTSIGLTNIKDLLYYFPRRYLDRNITENIILKQGEVVTLLGTVTDSYLAHGKKTRLVVGFRTKNNEKIQLVFFKGANFFQKQMIKDRNLAVTGKLEFFRGFQIVHPDFEILDADPDEADTKHLLHTGRIIPLYPSSESLKKEGMDSRGFRRAIGQVIESDIKIPEILDSTLLKKRNLIDRASALRNIHFPESDEQWQIASVRLKYEEIFYFQLLLIHKMQLRKRIKRQLWPLPTSQSSKTLLSNLPFELTIDQKNAIEKIKSLTSFDLPMACLLQGDVGSGKTLTALSLALHYTDNNIQVVFLAPTEILARQHYQSISKYMGNLPFLGIELLLGGEPKKPRAEKLYRIKTGESLIIVGTHSLFQDDVTFHEMGLVIIDEQHKFGVEQRENIRSKGKNPDVIAMTATPIPRTLSLTLYGDLDLITIPNKPAGRQPIDTHWFFDDKREGVYKSIRKYVSQGRQCYIVYPLVEESEKLDLNSCIQSYELLRKEIFPDLEIGLLHGKMKNQEKAAVMDDFKNGKINILVTTTVVEVGVDVPNASVLVVEHADRFGLSQLHQLRGRVGRGSHKSFCILLTGKHISMIGKERLTALTETEDGFKLSEVDLKLRGPGELLGLRQSGLPEFKIADIQSDEGLFQDARADALRFGEPGPLEREEIKSRFQEGRILFRN